MTSRSIRTACVALGLGVLVAGSVAASALVTVRDGALTARIAAVPLADLKSELEAAAAVDIRIATAELARHPVTATVNGERLAPALAYVLRDFNFVQFTDTATGRAVYLVTSLADPDARAPARPAAPVAPSVATTVAKTAVAPQPAQAAAIDRKTGKSIGPVAPSRSVVTANASTATTQPRSLDELQPITPATFDAYADQSIIDAEMARVRQATVDRDNSVLGNPASGTELQRQALNELVGLGDPSALATLRQLISDNRVLDSSMAADAVAQAAWRYAAQQQFANADANRLLQTMANSTQPQIQAIGQAAVRDSQIYLAKNPKP